MNSYFTLCYILSREIKFQIALHCLRILHLYFIVPTVYFKQDMYTVNENEVLEPVLILTGQASIDVIIQVSTIDGSAMG